MYLHLGQNVVVSEKEVIGFFDLDNTSGSHITRKFLNDAEKKGIVSSSSDEIPRSFVLCNHNHNTKVHLSQFTTQALVKRVGEI